MKIKIFFFIELSITFIFVNILTSFSETDKAMNQLFEKKVDFDFDGKIDTVDYIKYSKNIIFPKLIKWGKDSNEVRKITEIKLPNINIQECSFYFSKINYDQKLDLIIEIKYYRKEDTTKVNLLYKKYIIYGDDNLKNINKVSMKDINNFQRFPFLAQKEQGRYLTEHLKYIRINNKELRELKKINTDLIPEKQEVLQNIPDKTNNLLINIFPNPSNEILNIQNNTSERVSVAIYDLYANIVYTGYIEAYEQNIISTKDFGNGEYTLVFKIFQEIVESKKIIIVK